MLTTGAFWLGVAVGAVGSWLWARRQARLVLVAPHGPIPLSRRGRLGQSWPGQRDAYAR